MTTGAQPDSYRVITHELFMHRCLALAQAGAGHVAPNPMVGAVLVHEGRIIGEGYHQKCGEVHAEVNCIASVKEKDAQLISRAALYVSLEPCSHFGKTPPCTDLIIKNKIPEVIIGCNDPNRGVSGGGIEKLKAAGVKVKTGILEKECKELNRRFFTFHIQHRPYIILKWAQTADGKMAASANPSGRGAARLLISNEYTNRLTHKWRSEEAAILVGANTAFYDDPELTTRLWPGPSPVRLVIDMDLRLPSSLKLFDGRQRTIIFNRVKHEESDTLFYFQITEEVSPVYQVINALYQLKIQSMLVEGGARLLLSFMEEGMWDEIRKIENKKLITGNGLPAPEIPEAVLKKVFSLSDDTVHIYRNPISA
jgi:diaminohydroxyphosphoribosylaminopyrimidine deaminase/5-amino-6-(5-phosphoribosylamino)uracil reductase